MSRTKVFRLDAPKEWSQLGEYTIDAIAIEYEEDGTGIDFRFELGKGLGIFWALPAPGGDRLRLLHVDGAAYTVDEPELYEDPCVYPFPKHVWTGELARVADGSTFVRVELETSVDPPSYRCAVALRAANGDERVTILAWRLGGSP